MWVEENNQNCTHAIQSCYYYKYSTKPWGGITHVLYSNYNYLYYYIYSAKLWVELSKLPKSTIKKIKWVSDLFSLRLSHPTEIRINFKVYYSTNYKCTDII